MKIILILLFSSCIISLTAQNKVQGTVIPAPKHTIDTSEIIILRDKESSIPEEISASESLPPAGIEHRKGEELFHKRFNSFKGHWSGFNYGFVNFTHIRDEWKNLKLNLSHSFAMQFNLCKHSINLSPRDNFGLVTGMGLEYQRLRFDNDYTIHKTAEGIEPQEITEDPTVKRSCLKVFYLSIPLLAEVQFPASKNTSRLYVSGGFMGGVRMHSKTKIVCKDENGDKHKRKKSGDFDMIPFKVDMIARIGYRNLNVWGSYTMTQMFNDSGIHTYTIGLGLTF